MRTPAQITSADILSHLRDVLVKASANPSKMKESFAQITQGHAFTKGQYQLVLEHASATGVHNINDRYSSLWHLFKDPLGKRVSFFEVDEKPKETAMDVVLFSRWIKDNYSMIMEFELPESPPKIFSRVAEVSDFKTFLSYLDKTIVPALKQAICHEHKMTESVLEAALLEREKLLIENKITGVEVLWPIPSKKWLEASPK